MILFKHMANIGLATNVHLQYCQLMYVWTIHLDITLILLQNLSKNVNRVMVFPTRPEMLLYTTGVINHAIKMC